MTVEKRFALYRAIVRIFFCPFFPIRYDGVENVPAEGPVIICANHESLTDPIAISMALKRPISYMAKKEVFGVPVLGAFIRSLCAFPVDRGAGDLSAVRGSLALLKEGRILGIFPQGSRSFKHGKSFLSGVSLIALRSGAPVVPVLMEDRARIFRPIRLHFGSPVDLSDFSGPLNAGKLEQATKCIENAVYALRPEK